jgi:hypothetical protein
MIMKSEGHIDNRSDFEETLKVLEERINNIEMNGPTHKTEIAKSLLFGTLPQRRIHLVQEIARANTTAILGTMGVWTVCLTGDITDWRLALASGLSSLPVGVWRLYVRIVDHDVACLYPKIIQCEEDLNIPINLSELPKLRKIYSSAEEVRRKVEERQIGHRKHLYFDWVAFFAVFIMSIPYFYVDRSQLSWWPQWGALLHPYVLLSLNVSGALFVLWAMNAYQTKKGGLKRLWQGR